MNNVLMNFSAIYLTYNMFVICCNSREVKTCWKCIHLFKLVLTKRLYGYYAKQWLATLLKILYISSTFTNITISFVSITFVVLHWSNVFFYFHVSFLKINKNQDITLFASFFHFYASIDQLIFGFQK